MILAIICIASAAWIVIGLVVRLSLDDSVKNDAVWAGEYPAFVAALGDIVFWPWALTLPRRDGPIKKLRSIHGRHRQAAADHRDPQASGEAVTGTSSVTSAGPDSSGLMQLGRRADHVHGAGYIITATGLRPVSPLAEFDALVSEMFAAGAITTNQWLTKLGDPITYEKLKEMRYGLLAERPVSHEDTPIMAVRWAWLNLDGGGPMLTTLNHMALDVPDGEAKCRNGKDHLAPDWDCTCGFYAVPPDKANQHMPNDLRVPSTPVLLTVELSGRVIVTDEGYRAEHQRILSWRPPSCVHCSKPSGRLTLYVSVTGDGTGRRWWYCDEHYPADINLTNVYMVTTDLADALPVPMET